MAQRRMFSLKIINSARFMKMPVDTQNLYFHLGLHADDDGIVEAYPVMKITGANDDCLKVLAVKGFVKVLNEDLVTYITDWNEHNLIRADRKIDSMYKHLLLEIVPEKELIEPKPRADTGKKKGEKKENGRPMDNQWTAQGRVGQDRIGEDRVNPTSAEAPEVVGIGSIVNSLINEFEPVNPSFARLYKNKTQRSAIERLLKKYDFYQLQNIIRFLQKSNKTRYAPTITTPVQLEEKLGQLMAYCAKVQDENIKSGKQKDIIGL